MNNAQHIMRADVDWLLAAKSTAERIMQPRSEGPLAKLIEDFREEILDES